MVRMALAEVNTHDPAAGGKENMAPKDRHG